MALGVAKDAKTVDKVPEPDAIIAPKKDKGPELDLSDPPAKGKARKP